MDPTWQTADGSVKLVNEIDSASIRVDAVSSKVNDLLKTLEL